MSVFRNERPQICQDIKELHSAHNCHLPIPVRDVGCAITGADVPSQQLEGRGLPGAVHPQQAKALQVGTTHRVSHND